MSRKPRPDDQFLTSLAASLRPLPPRAGLARRYGGWVAAVGLGIALLGSVLTRPGLAERASEPDFMLQIIFWTIISLLAGASAFMLATPRWPMPGFVKWACAFLGLGFVGYAAWLLLRMPPLAHNNAGEAACMVIVSGIGIFTALCLTLSLKSRAKPTYPVLMGTLMATAGAGAGMLAILFVCPYEGAEHVLVSHFLPALAVGALVGWFGGRWWRW